MAKQNRQANNRASYRRASTSSKPSARAWIIAILIVIVFAGCIGFLDSHKKNNPTAFIHQFLQHSHSTTVPAKSPNFEFYTALPSGKLTLVSTTQATPAAKKVVTSSVVTPPNKTNIAATTSNKTVNSITTNTNYFLQVGSFPQYADADRLKAQLLLDNFNANTEKSMINGKEWYRVLVGPYYNLNTLNAAQTQLNTLHFQSIKLQLK